MRTPVLLQCVTSNDLTSFSRRFSIISISSKWELLILPPPSTCLSCVVCNPSLDLAAPGLIHEEPPSPPTSWPRFETSAARKQESAPFEAAVLCKGGLEECRPVWASPSRSMLQSTAVGHISTIPRPVPLQAGPAIGPINSTSPRLLPRGSRTSHQLLRFRLQTPQPLGERVAWHGVSMDVRWGEVGWCNQLQLLQLDSPIISSKWDVVGRSGSRRTTKLFRSGSRQDLQRTRKTG
jgi:hypothetical protein